MKVSDTRALGKSGLEVTVLGFGGVPLGNLYRALTDAEASATVHAVYAAGIRLIDTAPLYGFGMSEHRIGAAMRELPRDSWVLSTKIGRVLGAAKDPDKLDGRNFVKVAPYQPRFDYSYDGVMRSFEDSLQRLATHRIDILLIHDCDVWTHGSEQAYRARFKEVMDSGYKALAELRAAGVVKAIGVGVNEVQVCLDFLRAADFDCFLLAGRYTLLEQGALDELLPLLHAAQRLADHRRPVQFRHPRDRCHPGRHLQLQAGAARGHGQGAADRGGVRAPSGAAGPRRAAVPARPQAGRDHDSGRAQPRRGAAERPDLRSSPFRPTCGRS